MKKLSTLKGNERRKRIGELLASKNTRHLVPTKDLPSGQRREREKNARLDSPFVAGATVSNRDVARDRETATSLKYREPERQITSQIQDSQRFEGTQLPEYFKQYQQALREAEARTQANYQQATGQVGALSQGLANIAGTDQARVNEQMQQSAKARGATYDQAAADKTAQGAGLARAALTNSFGSMLATQGAADRQRLIEAVPQAQKRLGEEQATERGRRRVLSDKHTDLLRDKGDFRTQYDTERRDQENKAALERVVFGTETQLKRDQIKADAAKTRTAQENTDADNRRADEAADRAAEKDAYQRKHKLGPYKPTSPKKPDGKDEFGNTVKDRQRAQAKYDNARVKANPYKDAGQWKDWREFRDFLVSSKNIDSVYATAVAQKAILGKVGPDTLERLRRRGVNLTPSKAGRTTVTRPAAPSNVRGEERPN